MFRPGLFRVIGEKSFLDNGNLRDDTASPRVASIMQCNPITLPPDASMRDAVSLMSRERSDYVIVAITTGRSGSSATRYLPPDGGAD